MARKDYLSNKDAELLAWTTNFRTVLSANPQSYGTNDVVADDYTDKQDDFATKLRAATDPLTRGSRTVYLKEEAKRTLVSLTRRLVRQIGATMSVTDNQRQALGIPIASGSRTRKPAPNVAPYVEAVGNVGRTLAVDLRTSKTTRGKPADVTQAAIFRHVGPTKPMTQDQWQYVMNTTLTSVKIAFPPSETGTTVWITAFWQNAKGENGPAATAISYELPASGAQPNSAAASKPSMRLRAA